MSFDWRQSTKTGSMNSLPSTDAVTLISRFDVPQQKWTALSRSAFGLGGADVAQLGVQATRILEALDVSEQILPRLDTGGLDAVMDTLGFEGVEEALHGGASSRPCGSWTG